MRREEAIKELSVEYLGDSEKIKEAKRMAIKALEQEPCEDWYDVHSDEMTLEQARQAVKDLRKKLAEYLRQEPCEDVISRQAVLEKAYKIAGYDRNAYVVDVADIEALPSVSTAKIGQWIDDKCSLCGKGTEDLINNSEWYRNEEPNFCPFCGAKIRR